MIEEILEGLEKQREMYVKICEGELTFCKNEDGTFYIGNSNGLYNDYFTRSFKEWRGVFDEHPVSSMIIRTFYETYNWFTSPKDTLKVWKALKRIGTVLKESD